MEPGTLALAAAAIIGKAAAQAAAKEAGEAGWQVLGSLRDRVVGWFSAKDDDAGLTAVEEVTSGSAGEVDVVARAIESQLLADRRFEAVLESWIDQVENDAPPEVSTWIVQARDNAKVAIVDTVHGDLNL